MATYVYTAPYTTIYASIPLTASPTSGTGGTPTVWDWATPPTDGRWVATASAVNQAPDNGGGGNNSIPTNVVGRGDILLSGHGTPQNASGRDGDFWVDVDTNTLFGPRLAGLWPATGTLLTDANASVTALLAQNPFFVAHRGSGGEYPEHTMAAYSGSTGAGAQAIEVSVHVSADGVLFCAHDNDLTRITNGAWTTNPEQWTWAALQQRAKVVGWPLLGPGWADQPIATLREVLDRFLGHVVIFLEAKTSGAVVPMQTMLTTTYPGANKSVVIKGYYTSTSFVWAKAHGFKVWAYVDALPTPTSQAQMDAVDANVDLWGVPWEAADAQITACVNRPGGKPVMVWEVHRRSEVTRLTGLGVKGIMCSQYAYCTHTASTPMVTVDTFPTQVKAPGDIGAGHSDPNYALKWDTALDPGAVYLNQVGGQGLNLGSRACMLDGATGYKITFDMLWPALPSGTLHAGLYFGQTDDAKHTFAAANATACYRMEIRPNAGTMQLYTVAAGATSGVQVGGSPAGDVPTSGALSAGTWYSFAITVTATGITLARTDSTGWSRTFTDTSLRGRYFGIHNGSLTDLATVPRYRGLLPVPV